MRIPRFVEERKELLLAIAVAVVVLLIALSAPPSQENPFPSPSPTPAAVKLFAKAFPEERYLIGDTTLALAQSVKADEKGFAESLNITNAGNATAEISLIEVVPVKVGSIVDLVIYAPNAVEKKVLESNPAIEYSEYSLPPGGRVEKIVSSKNFAEASLVHALVSPRLSEAEQEALVPVLSEIGSLYLTPAEAKTVQMQANTILNDVSKTFQERLDLLKAYSDFIKSIKNPKPTPSTCASDKECAAGEECVEGKCSPLPSPSPSPEATPSPIELFPKLPDRITVVVSEPEPTAFSEFEVQAVIPLGSALLKFEGGVAPYSLASAAKLSELRSVITAKFDLSSAELVDGQFGFDELNGFLVISFASLFYDVRKVPVKIVVEHKNLWDMTLFSALQDDPDYEPTPDQINGFAQNSKDFQRPLDQTLFTGVVGGFVCPLSGRVSSKYGMRLHPITRKVKMHWGIDIGAASGTPIKAANDGVVVSASWAGGCGNAVKIDHGKAFTRYCHMSKISVVAGQRVSKGQVIGLVGSTGLSTGPHLHFEYTPKGKAPENPLKYVSC
jgi:murein DD-endopeptidase MepM/ murein hydrolase activator NlpD